MKSLQNRFTSPVTILSLIILIINQSGLLELIGLDAGKLNVIIDSILTIFVAFGVLNNPTTKDKF